MEKLIDITTTKKRSYNNEKLISKRKNTEKLNSFRAG